MRILVRCVIGPVELLLLSEVGQCRLMMGSEGVGGAILKPRARQNQRSSFLGLARSRRPHRDLLHAGGARCCLLLVRKPQAAVDQRKSFSSRHMRCSTIASLRATATSAFCMPRRLATASPQTFSEDHRTRGPARHPNKADAIQGRAMGQ